MAVDVDNIMFTQLNTNEYTAWRWSRQGMSTSDIAESLGFSRQHGYNLVNKANELERKIRNVHADA